MEAARTYASCCTPSKSQRRYTYLRPQYLDVQLAEEPASLQCSIHECEHSFNAALDQFMESILKILEMHDMEIVLFRALLTNLYSICCVVGDGRYLGRIWQSLAVRLRSGSRHGSSGSEHASLKQAAAATPPSSSSAAAAAAATTPTGLRDGDREGGGVLEKRRSKSSNLTIYTGCDGNEKEEEAGEEEDTGSDWDDSDGWSDEEDVAALELEAGSFLWSLKELSRQWVGETSMPENRRSLRRMLRMEVEACPSSWEDMLLCMPETVSSMVRKLTS